MDSRTIDETLVKGLLNISADEDFIYECYEKILGRKLDKRHLRLHLAELKNSKSRMEVIRSLTHSYQTVQGKAVSQYFTNLSFMEKIITYLKGIPYVVHLIIWICKWFSYRSLRIENIMGKHEEISDRDMKLSYDSPLLMERAYKESSGLTKEGRSSSLKVNGKHKISIIIPVYNKLEYTTMCLKTLEKYIPKEIDYEVVVVDDSSTEKAEKVLPEMITGEIKDKLHILRNNENLGFGQSINRGVTKAKGNIILLLNNDVFVTEGWMEAFLSSLDREDTDIIGGKLLYPDGTIQHAGGVFYCKETEKEFFPYHIYRGFPGNFIGVNKQRRFKWVTFACVMMQRQVFESLGGFDQTFKNSYEDVDFCLRATEKGYSILYEPTSIAYHLECSTRGYNKPQDFVNLKLLRLKYRAINEDDFCYYIEDGIPIEYGREYSNKRFTKRIKEIAFRIEVF